MVPMCSCPMCGGTGTITSNWPPPHTVTIGDYLGYEIEVMMRRNPIKIGPPVYPFLPHPLDSLNARFGPMWLFWVLPTRRTPRDCGCSFSRPQSRAQKSTWPVPRQRAARHVPGHAPRARQKSRALPARQRQPHQRPRQATVFGPVSRLMEKVQ